MISHDFSDAAVAVVTVLYRADAAGQTEMAGRRTWTASRQLADLYGLSGKYGLALGGPCVYQTVVPDGASVLDLGTDRASVVVLDRLGSFTYGSWFELGKKLRQDSIGTLIRSAGYAWVRFFAHQMKVDRGMDEWLYFGSVPLVVEVVPETAGDIHEQLSAWYRAPSE